MAHNQLSEDSALISATVPKEFAAKLTELAEKDHRTRSNLIYMLLQKAIKNLESQ